MVALYYILWQFNIFPELTEQHYLTYFVDEPESAGGVKSELWTVSAGGVKSELWTVGAGGVKSEL